MYTYPIHLEPAEEGGFVVTLPDLPGCITEGDSHEEAVHNAVGAARALLAALVRDREDIPLPSPANGRPVARLPALDTLKLRLYLEMRAQDVSQSDLARRLGKTPKDVWRLLDLTHASRMDQIEAAFGALGLVVTTDVRKAA
ncbi:type II toxin-antitoxin system HicB family antitoxin [Pararhodospirillum oryzae]|uniref:Antitoxin HicB n=1 Tax=Pararhodospirillum oryzae TaxID=478448 RepID=A0A512HAZ9_9PROT|nr:type II toxin-antitoxin system HicB family antitoxin [Pararhodospirillum oryzae]GEO82637.1 antitoxin HicB [Pararhodospirillum oryzae]